MGGTTGMMGNSTTNAQRRNRNLDTNSTTGTAGSELSASQNDRELAANNPMSELPLLGTVDQPRLDIAAAARAISNQIAAKLSDWTARQWSSLRARDAEGDERERLWAQMVAIYPSYTEYQQRTSRKIPVVVLEPVR